MTSSESVAGCTFASTNGYKRGSILLPLLFVLFSIATASSLLSEEIGGTESAPLRLMPLPRSVMVGTGHLVLDTHFAAGFSGAHDARLDAALDRTIRRLDRQCGDIRRAQYLSGPSGSPVLSVKVAPMRVYQGQ